MNIVDLDIIKIDVGVWRFCRGLGSVVSIYMAVYNFCNCSFRSFNIVFGDIRYECGICIYVSKCVYMENKCVF